MSDHVLSFVKSSRCKETITFMFTFRVILSIFKTAWLVQRYLLETVFCHVTDDINSAALSP
jgi:hypothetical protein